MPDTEKFKSRLIDKERELLSDLARLQREARESVRADVGDTIDLATASEIETTYDAETTLEWRTLKLVRAALRRIDNGTFARCVECGRPIEPARLEAVPWTPYCLRDQERHDRA
jgi:DnaK suppressor protein